MNHLITRSIFIAGVAAFSSGCIGGSNTVRYMKERPAIPNLVAVLPPTNNSMDTAAPDTIRRAAAEMLLGLGMVPIVSPAQEDQLIGIQSEKTLAELDPKEVAQKLGVDGLLYITINQFNDINAIVYAQRVVGATMQLFNKNGDKIWEIEGTGYNRAITASPQALAMNAGKAAMAASKMDLQGKLERMLNVHLLAESQMMAGFMSPKLPSWPEGNKPAADLAASEAAEAAAKAAKKQ